jgi:hypothetical protein
MHLSRAWRPPLSTHFCLWRDLPDHRRAAETIHKLSRRDFPVESTSVKSPTQSQTASVGHRAPPALLTDDRQMFYGEYCQTMPSVGFPKAQVSVVP